MENYKTREKVRKRDPCFLKKEIVNNLRSFREFLRVRDFYLFFFQRLLNGYVKNAKESSGKR